MSNNLYTCTGEVTAIIANMVIVKADGPVRQNEICYYKGSCFLQKCIPKMDQQFLKQLESQ